MCSMLALSREIPRDLSMMRTIGLGTVPLIVLTTRCQCVPCSNIYSGIYEGFVENDVSA